MATASSGFYIPSHMAKDYVSNMKTEDGSYKYDINAEGKVYSSEAGIKAQAAIQNLESTYSDTINNAYSQYINSKHTIMNSTLGEGFKQRYLQQQNEAYQQSLLSANATAEKARQEILVEEDKLHSLAENAFSTEVKNMNTAYANLGRYLEYAKTLKKSDTDDYYLTAYERSLTSPEAIYDRLFDLQPTGYVDDKSAAGLSFIDWMKTQVSTEDDQAWFDWLTLQNGYTNVQDAAFKSIKVDNDVEPTKENAIKHLQETRQLDTYKYNIINKVIPEPDLGEVADIRSNDFDNALLVRDWGVQYDEKVKDRAIPAIEKYMTDVGVNEQEVNTYLQNNPIVWKYRYEYNHRDGYTHTKEVNIDSYDKLIEVLYTETDILYDKGDFDDYSKEIIKTINNTATLKYVGS